MKSEIIIGSDLKQTSRSALEVGTSWASFLKAQPVVLHVHPSQLENSSAFLMDQGLEKKFQELSETIKENLQEQLDEQVVPFEEDGQHLSTKIRFGDRAKAFIKRSIEKESKLIVLGWDEDLTKETIWMASTIDRVIRASYSPVLVVKDEKAKAPRKILFPFEFNNGLSDALEWARILASQFQSNICLLHVYEGDIKNKSYQGFELLEYLYPNFEDELQYLKSFISDVSRMGGSVDFKIINDDSPEGIVLDEISKQDPDLTIVAMRKKKGIQRLYLGSMTEKILKVSNTSVFVSKAIV